MKTKREKDASPPVLLSRSEANTAGHLQDFGGRVCKYHGSVGRWTCNAVCITCSSEGSERYRKANPEWDRARHRKYQKANKPKLAAKARRQRRQNPTKEKAKVKKGRLRRKYGLTVEQYEEMFESQGGLCAICGRTECESVGC